MNLLKLLGGIAAILVVVATVAYAANNFSACPLAAATAATPYAGAAAPSPATGCCGMRGAIAAAPVPQVEGKAQTLCPIMGAPINKRLYVDVLGKRIYYCCGGCAEAIRANPEAALQKIAANGEEAESLTK